MKNLFLVFMMALVFSSCKTKLESFTDLLNKQDNILGVEVLKTETLEGGEWAVLSIKYLDENGNYYHRNIRAVNLASYQKGMSLKDFYVENDTNLGNHDDEHFHGYFCNFFKVEDNGDGTYTTDEYDHDEHGVPMMTFSEDVGFSKDLEKIASFKEALKNDFLSKRLQHQYGLSEGRALEIARIISNVNKLRKKRSLTDSDFNILSKKILGVNAKMLENSLKNEDHKLYDELLKKSSDVNNISPEHMKELLQDFLI